MAGKRTRHGLLTALIVALTTTATAATWRVGPGEAFKSPCDAFNDSRVVSGDTVEIAAAGSYQDDSCIIRQSGLTIRGTGGRPRLHATRPIPNGMGIWAIKGHNTTIENIEFSGARVPDLNGAGIRLQANNLTVRHCYFHNNENGILVDGSDESEIIIEHSEFHDNGVPDGTRRGLAHNIYLNRVARFTFRYNYTHNSIVGHLIKSRARENHILYNRITGEAGTGSYEIDIPNAGLTYIIGNIIQQGPHSENSNILAYGMELDRSSSNPSQSLLVINNTFINNRASGMFIRIGSEITSPAIIRNNIFHGPGTLTNQANAVLEASCTDPHFINHAEFDYRLQPSSPCIDAGTPPGSASGFDLTPKFEYVHPTSAAPRQIKGAIDIGAYEAGGSLNRPPSANITAPSSSFRFKVGDVIFYSGNAADPEDGTIPSSQLAWNIILHRCDNGTCQSSTFKSSTGTSESFTVPDIDNIHFDIRLTATDSDGLTDTQSLTIRPLTTLVTLNTSPSGLVVVYDGVQGAAPLIRTAIVGSTHTINAPSPQGDYVFRSWSDGGAQQHEIRAGSEDTTYTANFQTQPSTCAPGQFRAEYFNNRTLSGTPVLVRCESAPLTHDWGHGSPASEVNADNFSVRWTGQFSFPAGSHTFIARADDGVRVSVGGTRIIDAWRDQSATEYRATRTLPAGEHTVVMEYYENTGRAVAQLRW
jgi:hypothetical protein